MKQSETKELTEILEKWKSKKMEGIDRGAKPEVVENFVRQNLNTDVKIKKKQKINKQGEQYLWKNKNKLKGTNTYIEDDVTKNEIKI